VYLKAYDSVVEARRQIGSYFNFYNTKRRHQGLDDRFPDEVYWGTIPQKKAA